MNSKDYDRKFWLVVENGNKKSMNFILILKAIAFFVIHIFQKNI